MEDTSLPEERPSPPLKREDSQLSGRVNGYFIHFDNVNDCIRFRNYYTDKIGHVCCDGKGCLLPNETSQKNIHTLQKAFLNK
jgi:hypothetical protein